MGPPWQMDWTLKAQAARDSLPEHVRKVVDAARAELVTAKDPYFRGIETDVDLPDGMKVQPVQSTEPKGAHVLLFDSGHGWMTYTFIRRTEDPQIIVEELFWQ
ncbi:hypothetical protein JW592_18220 [Streptomyces sp. DW4-2]|uniref:Uncharacterized protein n=2 Tax=Streptomyces spirodelae TaxID=2812904 RepID=A0ABS3WX13_9ACTN|nr:hypothetical protein [Streptomyces spirodelae]